MSPLRIILGMATNPDRTAHTGQVTREKTRHLYNLHSLRMTDVPVESLFYTEGSKTV